MIKLQKGLFKGNGRLTQYFGSNASAYAKFGLKGHNGIDYGIPNGTELYSAINGKVTEVANDTTGYGKYVKIENDQAGVIYGHLQSFKVKVGDVVKAGQLIGLSNNSGNSTGPHLHFGVFPKPRNRNNGYAGYIDPFDKKLVTWVDKLDEGSTTGETPIYVEISPSKKLPDDFYKINEFKKLKDRKLVKGDEAFDTLMSILLTTDEDRNRAVAELEEQKKHFDEEVEALNKTRKQLLKEQKEAFDSEREAYETRIKELEEKLSISNNDMAKKEIGSPALSLNKSDAKKWAKNTAIFFAPVLLTALLTLVNEIPKEATWGVIALFVVNVVIDLVRKFIKDNSK
jgi:septal ring factor EnvC (AmiA/AmiB activator)